MLLCFPALLLAQSRGIAVEPNISKPTPFVKGIYRALVIGNNQYRDPKSRWKNLTRAEGDARAVADLLRQQYGFSAVDLMLNATRKDILHRFEQLGKQVAANDSVLVFYAGHGFLDPDTGRGYWVPVDAAGMDTTTFIRNSTVRDELSIIAQRVKHTLLISDSCFSGSLLGSGLRGVVPNQGQEHYYRKVAEKKSVQIIAAGGLEYVDDNYKNSGHSPFTYFFLNELKLNDKPLITASELSTSVKKAVANNVSQVPAAGVLQGVGDELGEFIFLNLNIEVSVEGVPQDKVKVRVHVNQAKNGSGEVKINSAVVKANPQPDLDYRYLPLPGF